MTSKAAQRDGMILAGQYCAKSQKLDACARGFNFTQRTGGAVAWSACDNLYILARTRLSSLVKPCTSVPSTSFVMHQVCAEQASFERMQAARETVPERHSSCAPNALCCIPSTQDQLPAPHLQNPICYLAALQASTVRGSRQGRRLVHLCILNSNGMCSRTSPPHVGCGEL